MARVKKYSPEQIVSLLREVEVAVANGKTTGKQRRVDHRAHVRPLAQGVRANRLRVVSVRSGARVCDHSLLLRGARLVRSEEEAENHCSQ